MRSQSLTRSFAALALVSMFLLSAFARPALAQTPDKHKVKPPNVSFSNKKFNFGQIFVGDISSPQTETITNDSSTTAVTISDITAASPFHIISDNCTTSLAAGASCEVGVDFQPTKKGKVKAKKGLNFTDSAQKSPQHIELQGDGVIQTQPTATATATATQTATATATTTSTATATATATPTATSTATTTATSTGATATATPTATSTGATATATSTATATATASATSTVATPTATPSPGPQAGDVLIAGGDSGGVLGGEALLATSTVSTASSEIYEALSDAFLAVGPLKNSREASATAVVLPNQEILIAGGSHCYAQAINKTVAISGSGATESGSTVTITTSSVNGFAVGQTVVIAGVGVAGYNGTFTITALTSSSKFTYTDPTTGLAASGGGTATQNPEVACGSSAISGFECDALQTAELYNENTGTFTLAGAGGSGLMTTARSGATATLLDNGQVLITGGSSGSSFLSLNPAPAGCGPQGQVAQNTAEIYDPVADTFTATTPIPGCTLGTAPPACTTGLPANCPVSSVALIASSPTGATESGSTVTITTTTANNFIAGQAVEIGSVGVTGYNGTFTIASIVSPTQFTYTALTSGLAASGGGAASSDTGVRQCGLVDSAAALLNDGTVLVAGGDYVEFLGQSSQQAFVYTPTGATWAQVAPLNVPRELPGITKLLTGEVLVTGGVTAASAACPTDSGGIAITSNFSAETYDPATQMFTLTSGSSATPGAAGGMSVARVASAELFTTGPDSGMAILAAGVDAESTNGSGVHNFPTCEPITNLSQTTETATDLYDPSTTKFTATGALNQDRAAYTSAILNSGSFSGDLAVFGGDCGNGSLESAVIGTMNAGSLCDGGSGTARTDYYELYSPAAGTWALGTATTPAAPAAGAASALLP